VLAKKIQDPVFNPQNLGVRKGEERGELLITS
jgi:hypothetical protein